MIPHSSTIQMGAKLALLIFYCFTTRSVRSSKVSSGQRVFTETKIIDFVDPAKHGFHIILNEEFVNTQLQPIRLPTIFATAIALKQPQWHQRRKEEMVNSSISASATATTFTDGLRVTKILYPENVDPDGGLLDGRTIKLLGLQERTWYYVCVEFESNINRHESATGASCVLKRTLDKFGKTTDSTVSEVELSDATDRSIVVRLRVETDFPLRISVYLNQEFLTDVQKSIPTQTFILVHTRNLNVMFGPNLDPDTSYGRLCVVEEPLAIPSNTYTAMGRSVHATMHQCYFDDLKTVSASPALNSQDQQQLYVKSPDRLEQAGIRILPKRNAATSITYSLLVFCFCFFAATN